MNDIIKESINYQHPKKWGGKRRKKEQKCHCCGKFFTFCWTCHKCGFQICQECMKENAWGMTCNNIDWECPDCGAWNGYGNQ